ncbi:MAG: DMT family transporter [Pseudoclavibacter sp.]
MASPGTPSTTPPAAPSRARLVLDALITVAAGLTMPVQSRMNGALASEISDPVFAAFVSFGSGFVLLTVLLVLPGNRRALSALWAAIRSRRMQPWLIVAGALGAWLVIAQSISVGVFGVALFMISLIAGQTVSGLLVDRFGFLSDRRQPLTPMRVISAAVTIVAVVWSVSGSIPAGLAVGTMLLTALLPLSAGILSGFQQAMNGRIATITRAPFSATYMNFVAGSVALLVVTLIERTSRGLAIVPQLPGVWWMYLGGAMGIVFIFTGAHMVPRIGVLRFTIAAIGGQLLGSLLLDWVWPTSTAGVSFAAIGGAVLTFGAIALSALPDVRRRR